MRRLDAGQAILVPLVRTKGDFGTSDRYRAFGLRRSAAARRNDADLLREIYAETGSFSDVAHRQADIWATSVIPGRDMRKV